MKRKIYSTTKIVAWVLSGVLTASTSLLVADGFSLLESQFSDPPDAFGVNCWWWWLNGNTDKDAIIYFPNNHISIASAAVFLLHLLPQIPSLF